MKNCLIVFAREPRRGTVKTRLAGVLCDADRLKLYNAFLLDTIASTRRVRCDERVIAYDAGSSFPRRLKAIGEGFTFYRQEGRDLGDRMHAAFQYAQAMGAQKTVIIGSDSPDLPQEYIEQAFRKLDKADLVLGPSIDGGYYLIGLKKPCWGLFDGVRWSSGSVLSATLRKARACGKKIALLKEWYDVDTPESFGWLVARSKRYRSRKRAWHTRRIVSCLTLKQVTP